MERIVQRVQFPEAQKVKLLRTAAYARVSSGKDAMLHSLSAQVSYYNDLIQSNPEWLFCGVFADEALTGTKDNRENFQKLLSECRAGRIDLVITKSISRFARNTVTLLETVRELKELGVDVYFEEQNIHSISPDGELMLTILASYAQEESLSASENQKWRIRKDFERGRMGSITMLGYKRNKNGVLEIIPEEAEIVRMIFSDYLSGMGKNAIANKLHEMGVPTKGGGIWTAWSIRRILRNEKYCGDILFQKSFRENHITKRKIENKGQLPQYYAEEAHEPIISKEVFLAVQEQLRSQQDHFTPDKPTTGVYPLTGMIHCECCGKYYRRKVQPYRVTWICHTYNARGKKYCPDSKQIPEDILYEKCCEVLQLDEFDNEVFQSEIESITVPKPNVLTFIFKDGHKQTVHWLDHSRTEAWTPEKRAMAAEHSKKRGKKCQK
ncbi:recombinase family protein [Ruminococcus sp.]|uniref:recombinase family protein n=1 Tax=Ruminococcus sp. TaxID=41978 RepID=UPI0025F58EA4|nr:recombinase family protein [Ruminococcus sp.]